MIVGSPKTIANELEIIESKKSSETLPTCTNMK